MSVVAHADYNTKISGSVDDLDTVRMGIYRIGSKVEGFFPYDRKKSFGGKFKVDGKDVRGNSVAFPFYRGDGSKICERGARERLDRAIDADWFDLNVSYYTSVYLRYKGDRGAEKVLWVQKMTNKKGQDLGTNAYLYIFEGEVVGFYFRNNLKGGTPTEWVERVESKFGKPELSSAKTAENSIEAINVLQYQSLLPSPWVYKDKKTNEPKASTYQTPLAKSIWTRYFYDWEIVDGSKEKWTYQTLLTQARTESKGSDVFSVVISSFADRGKWYRHELEFFVMKDLNKILKAQNDGLSRCVQSVYDKGMVLYKKELAKRNENNSF
ncbi:hypothetical protein AB4262_11255 [Vibrio breoganii]